MSKRFKFISKKKKGKFNLFGIENNNEIGGAHIELFSNKEISIDGCCGVFDYAEDYIRLNIGKGSVMLCGKNFDIVYFENQQITVKGNISSLEFCV